MQEAVNAGIENVIHVAVGIIDNGRGEVLISRRPSRAHEGDLWEFPGGKVEAGETVEEALLRELAEELNISVRSALPLMKIAHTYPDRRVLLDVWQVQEYSGRPEGLEGQPIAWVPPCELVKYRFPEADLPILKALGLPDYYAILDLDTAGSEAALLNCLERILSRGVKLIQLRAKSLPPDRYLRLARAVCCRSDEESARILLNAEPELVSQAGAAGVHFTSRRLLQLTKRPTEGPLLVAASCHDLTELAHAQKIGADFAVLAPVKKTGTHPDAAALGWARFHSLVLEVNIPVYALGGLSRDELEEARRHGAQGIAGIRMFLR